MQVSPSILVIDKDRDSLEASLDNVNLDFHYTFFTPANPEEILPYIRKNNIDILLLDLSFSKLSQEFQLLKKLHREYEQLLIITIIPADNHEFIKVVLEADVFFYVKKPFDHAEVTIALTRAIEKFTLNFANSPSKTDNSNTDFYGIIGKSGKMMQLFDLITRVAEDDYSTVLIRGESGTGKELVAKAIHSHSKRCKNNFVPVNCAAIPDDLLESELFGHTKGAFTGATQNKQGRIQYADGGTLFLDEIGDMKPSLQAKLLRVLQEKEFEPVGALKATPVDTRVLAATHCDLETLVNEGKFREDLYYRLSVVPLNIPPLKERKQDIPLLLDAFITKYTKKRGKEKLSFSSHVLNLLMEYEWRGNVRELENLVQHMSILFSGKEVALTDLPEKYQNSQITGPGTLLTQHPSPIPSVEQISGNSEQPIDVTQIKWNEGQIDFKEIINNFEKQLILQAMKLAGGNKKEAAKILNLKRTTLLEKIKKKELQNLWED